MKLDLYGLYEVTNNPYIFLLFLSMARAEEITETEAIDVDPELLEH